MTKRLDSVEPASLVSVIVVNYNGLNVIKRCLDSILLSTYPRFEVMVVDNASTDGSLQLIERNYKADLRLEVIACQRNLGYAEGCNLGAGKARGKYLVFLNYDTETEPDTMASLVSVIQQDQSIGAAQSKLLMMTDRKRLDSAGDVVSTIGWPYSLGKYEIDKGQYDDNQQIFAARGAAMIVRSEIFREIGGFDPDYFMYYEDVDLSWRMKLRGYKIAFAPQSIVYHSGGALSESRNSFGTLQNLWSGRNYISTLIKNLELRNLLTYGSAHIAVHFGTVLWYLTQRRVHEMLGLILAIASVIENLPTIWGKRQLVQCRIRSVRDTEALKCIKRTPISRYFRESVARRMLDPSARFSLQQQKTGGR